MRLKNAVHNYLKLTTLSRLFVLEQQALHFFKGKIFTPKSILVQTYLLPTRNGNGRARSDHVCPTLT